MFAYMRSLAAAAALAAISAPSAFAQAQLDLDVDFDFPALVLLRCVDDITLVLDADTLLAAAGVESTTDTAAGAEIAESEQAGIFNATGASLEQTSFTDLPIVLNSICSIRAIGAGSTVEVNLTLQNDTLQGPANVGTIVVSDLLGRDGGATLAGDGGGFASEAVNPAGAADGDFDVDVSGGFAQLAFVDVRFDLDLSGASEAGVYSTVGGGDLFTIEVNTD
ncbi:MAG: hypothetical protein AAF763_05085 [Pseudomonadota bacterium]